MKKNVWKKSKNYGLVKLSKQENIRRQIGNIISLPLIPPNEINNSTHVNMKRKINALKRDLTMKRVET